MSNLTADPTAPAATEFVAAVKTVALVLAAVFAVMVGCSLCSIYLQTLKRISASLAAASLTCLSTCVLKHRLRPYLWQCLLYTLVLEGSDAPMKLCLDSLYHELHEQC